MEKLSRISALISCSVLNECKPLTNSLCFERRMHSHLQGSIETPMGSVQKRKVDSAKHNCLQEKTQNRRETQTL